VESRHAAHTATASLGTREVSVTAPVTFRFVRARGQPTIILFQSHFPPYALAFAYKTEAQGEGGGLGSVVIDDPADTYRQLRVQVMQGLESIGKSRLRLNPSLRPPTCTYYLRRH
jgi:hypothetical protein